MPSISKDNLSPKNDKYKNVHSVIEFIKKNYDKNHSIQFYANICNLDKYYFIKIFSEYTGESPHLFRTKIRIEKAKELLRDTNMTNAEIAERVGYSTAYYFSRIFKIYAGVSPVKFRKNINGM